MKEEKEISWNHIWSLEFQVIVLNGKEISSGLFTLEREAWYEKGERQERTEGAKLGLSCYTIHMIDHGIRDIWKKRRKIFLPCLKKAETIYSFERFLCVLIFPLDELWTIFFWFFINSKKYGEYSFVVCHEIWSMWGMKNEKRNERALQVRKKVC